MLERGAVYQTAQMLMDVGARLSTQGALLVGDDDEDGT